MWGRFLNFLYEVPLWESLIFLILTVITVYRKRLSSNDIYRQQASRQQLFRLPPSLDLDRSRVLLSKYNRMLQNMIFSQNKADLGSSSKDAEDKAASCSLNRLSSDLLVHLLGYLETHEIVSVSLTSVEMRRSFTSDMLWEQLWRSTYADHWRHESIAAIRRAREIYWDPIDNFGPPQTGWFHFYLTFEVCWLDWILAGFSTEERCLVAIGGAIFDVTSFLFDHPGSPETMTEGSGCDATEIFDEIGHSIFAEGLKRRLCLWEPHGQHLLKPRRPGGVFTLDEGLRAPNLRVPRQVRLRSLMKSMQKSIANIAMETLLPQPTDNVKRAALAAQRIALRRPSEESPPLFGPLRPAVKGLGGYLPCPRLEHLGHAKACYDPLAGEWSIWWSCCGQVQPFLMDYNKLGVVQ